MALDPHMLRVLKEAEQMAIAEEVERKGHVMEKSWGYRLDPTRCEVCRRNTAAGWIPLHDPFPSGHQTAPAHDGCRCRTITRIRPGQR
ncbi:MAG: hypothetical protein LUQ25_06145 [Methanoregulaceae archaeon]|nr:hypothetical protein [Methanoregulaceae archaeon]